MEVTETFAKEVFKWRVYEGLGRGCLLQFVVLAAFLAVANVSPLAPFSVLLSPSSWFYDLLVASSVVGVGHLFARHVSMTPHVRRSPLSDVAAAVTDPRLLLSLLGHAIAGGLLARSYLGLLGGPHNALVRKCAEEAGRCLDHQHLFVVLAGVFSGARLWHTMHFENGNLAEFPAVALSGGAQLRLRWSSIVRASLARALHNAKWFCLLYLPFGYRVHYNATAVFRLRFDRDEEATFPFLAVFVSVIPYAVVFDALVTVSVRLLKEVLAITLLKPVAIDSVEQLAAAMKDKKSDWLRHLAFQRFVDVATSSRQMREEIFTLSQPGGHPRNWDGISGAALQVIDEFVDELNKSCQNAPSTSAATAPVPTHPYQRIVGPAGANNNSTVKGTSGAKSKGFLDQLADRVLKNPLFAAYADAKVRMVFAKSQLVIFAVEGLAQMLSASVFEDRFGVVQRKLAKVLTSLLNLQQTVERHKGLTTSLKKTSSAAAGAGQSAGSAAPKKNNDLRDVELKQELRSAVKTSLYRISVSFGEHLAAVPLMPEHKQKMENFRLFLEG